MYSNEKNPGINWKDLIIKAIFLVLFLLLLVWLFPKVPNMKPFYSNVFRENIKYMQDAAESYYTTEKLPKNIGDTAEMSLQEMINKNLILPFVDQDGNECDTLASYVQVKKNQNDYTLKVNLVCPTEKNYVEKTLGCYEYCETCKEELEYQFKKQLTSNKTTYSCPEGGTLNNGMCYIYKTNSYKATETTSKGEYYCPEGGALSGTMCYVSKTNSYNASTSNGGYYCPEGGTLSGTMCYVSDSYSYLADQRYECQSGFTLSGTICVMNTGSRSYAASVEYYTCPDGTRQSSSNCTTTVKGSTYTAKAVITETKVKYTTPKSGSAYTPLGTTFERVCSTCSNYATFYNYLYKTTKYECNKGGSLISGTTTCQLPSSTSTTTGKAKYYCPNNGTLSGTTCVIQSNKITYTPTPTSFCPAGTTKSGNRCYVDNSYTYKASKNADQKYCPQGGTLNSNGKCVIETSYTYAASKNADQKYCPQGGTLSNDKCVIDASYTYNASKTTGNTVLTCPNGGELKDKSCYIAQLSNSYKAKATTSKVTYYSYQWSKDQSLEGWTPTGETRVTATSMASK